MRGKCGRADNLIQILVGRVSNHCVCVVVDNPSQESHVLPGLLAKHLIAIEYVIVEDPLKPNEILEMYKLSVTHDGLMDISVEGGAKRQVVRVMWDLDSSLTALSKLISQLQPLPGQSNLCTLEYDNQF